VSTGVRIHTLAGESVVKNNDNDPSLKAVKDLLPAGLRPPGQTIQRLFDAPEVAADDDSTILYQHSVLCQTCLPFRDPGDQVRSVERANGLVSLVVAAGQAFHPDTRHFVDVGLPFGPKPRLVLYHLNAEALRTQSPVIELEDSLTAFVKRTLGLDPGGRTIRTVKDQLTRLSAADFRIGTVVGEGRAVTLKGCVIEGFELWVARDPQQRVLWPTTVQFSQRYFESLMRHAVPLNEVAIARLSHNAMALDIYTWLAQRLHRVEEGKGAFVPWVSISEQFGHGYVRIRKFRSVFVSTLRQVKMVYPDAKFGVSGEGMTLKHSRPPVARRLLPVGPV
jgi:hypothetical protein